MSSRSVVSIFPPQVTDNESRFLRLHPYRLDLQRFDVETAGSERARRVDAESNEDTLASDAPSQQNKATTANDPDLRRLTSGSTRLPERIPTSVARPHHVTEDPESGSEHFLSPEAEF